MLKKNTEYTLFEILHHCIQIIYIAYYRYIQKGKGKRIFISPAVFKMKNNLAERKVKFLNKKEDTQR